MPVERPSIRYAPVLTAPRVSLAWLLGAVAVVVVAIIYSARTFAHVTVDPERLAMVTVGVSVWGFW